MDALVEAIALLGLAVSIWGIFHCLRTGVATPGHYIPSSRDKQPVLFRVQLTVYALVACASLALATQCVSRAGLDW